MYIKGKIIPHVYFILHLSYITRPLKFLYPSEISFSSEKEILFNI